MKITVNENDMMVLSEGKLELYVYQKYIGTKMGIMSGNTLETIGLLPYRWYKRATDTKPTNEEMRLKLEITEDRYELTVGCLLLSGPITVDGFDELKAAFDADTATVEDANKFFRRQTGGVAGTVVK